MTNYMKQTYRNRCTIAGPEGELALSIPTVKPEGLNADERYPDFGSWELEASTLECNRVGL